MNSKQRGISYQRSAVDWACFVRELFKEWRSHNLHTKQFSGEVEMDESLFGHRTKYNRGEREAWGMHVWIFGMVEPRTNRIIRYPVETRDRVTLETILNNTPQPGPSRRALLPLSPQHGARHQDTQPKLELTLSDVESSPTDTHDGCALVHRMTELRNEADCARGDERHVHTVTVEVYPVLQDICIAFLLEPNFTSLLETDIISLLETNFTGQAAVQEHRSGETWAQQTCKRLHETDAKSGLLAHDSDDDFQPLRRRINQEPGKLWSDITDTWEHDKIVLTNRRPRRMNTRRRGINTRRRGINTRRQRINTRQRGISTSRCIHDPYLRPRYARGKPSIASLTSLGQYREALSYIGTSDSRWMLEKMLSFEVDKGRSPCELGTEDRDVLVRLMSSDMVRNNDCADIFDLIVEKYFPDHAKECWDTFIVHGAGMVDKNQFLTDVSSALKRRLYYLLLVFDLLRSSDKSDVVKEHRREFGKLVLTAVKPLRCDSLSSCHHGSADYSLLGELFSEAVSLGLLSEAVLLYDTGSVCPKELAALAQDQKVQKMITGDDNSPMAEFLRQVVNQPPSLKSCCRVQLARLLGNDMKGKMDRARSLGLPTSLCESLVNLHQTKQYMRSINEKYADRVKEKEADSMDTDSDPDFQALSQLIEF